MRVAADRLWGAQTQRALEHFTIGQDLIPLTYELSDIARII